MGHADTAKSGVEITTEQVSELTTSAHEGNETKLARPETHVLEYTCGAGSTNF